MKRSAESEKSPAHSVPTSSGAFVDTATHDVVEGFVRHEKRGAEPCRLSFVRDGPAAPPGRDLVPASRFVTEQQMRELVRDVARLPDRRVGIVVNDRASTAANHRDRRECRWVTPQQLEFGLGHLVKRR
jgi:hypothetical protein